MFGFQRLDVYRAAIAFLGHATRITTGLPRGSAEIADQLRRAALSIPLNIAEGSAKRSREAARFYDIARGSALECAAILDVLDATAALEGEPLHDGRALLERIVAMLSVLTR